MAVDVWISLVILFMLGGLTPGPAVGLVMASAFRYGSRSAMLAALGIATANWLWILLAASGAVAIFTQVPGAFMAMKVLGFLVILYLAASTIFGPLPNPQASADIAPPKAKLYGRGITLQISSPMPLVYFGGLLPAYFDITKNIAPQILIMFATITATELLGLWVYAAGAQKIKAVLQSPPAARRFNIIIGVLMLVSGAWAIFATS